MNPCAYVWTGYIKLLYHYLNNFTMYPPQIWNYDTIAYSCHLKQGIYVPIETGSYTREHAIAGIKNWEFLLNPYPSSWQG